jgi:hypothetical protein
MVQIDGSYTASGNEYMDMEVGTAVSHDIPANTFDAPLSNVFIMVMACNRTESLGSHAKSGSEFGVANVKMSALFDTN